jgi:hypothetical protein
LNQTIKQEIDEIEKLKNKLFCVENVIVKKDNIILSLKKKIEKFSENEDVKYLNYVEKEILLVEPTVAINQIYNEVNSLKDINDNLIKHINDNRYQVKKYETVINVYYINPGFTERECKAKNRK